MVVFVMARWSNQLDSLLIKLHGKLNLSFLFNGIAFPCISSRVNFLAKNDHKMKFCEILFCPQEPSNGALWTRDFHHKKISQSARFLARRWGGRSADSVG